MEDYTQITDVTKLHQIIAKKNQIIHGCVQDEGEIEDLLTEAGYDVYDDYGHKGLATVIQELIEDLNEAWAVITNFVEREGD